MSTQRSRQGFLLITTLMVVSGLLVLSAVSMTRSATDLLVANRFVASQQAFALAEGGLDAELVLRQGTFTPADIAQLIAGGPRTVTVSSGKSYTVWYADNDNPNDTRCFLMAQGTVTAGGTQTLRALVALSGPSAGPFDYAMAASDLTLSGNAQLGDGTQHVPLYIDAAMAGGSGGTFLLTTAASSRAYVSKVDFVAMASDITTLCPRCPDNTVFPPPKQFNVQVPRLPNPVFDFAPYYAKALDQMAKDGNPLHHITADTTITGSSGSGCLAFEGIMYIEAGVNVTIERNVCIHGTIIAEGDGVPAGLTDPLRHSTIRATSSAKLQIDSFRSPVINGTPESPFAPGMAVIGSPIWDFQRNTELYNFSTPGEPGIKGFVMGGSADQRLTSEIASSGTIEGGVLGVASVALVPGVFWSPNRIYFVEGMDGPQTQTWNTPGPVEYGYSTLLLGGSATVLFRPLPSGPPGMPPSTSAGRPTLLVWSVE